MSVEVKQLIVKSTLVGDRREGDRKASDIDLERLQRQVIEKCRGLIERRLETSRER